MSRHGLLQTGKMLPIVEDALGKAFDVYRLEKPADLDAVMAAHADSIAAVATGGHVKIDSELMSRLPNLKVIANFGVGYDTVDSRWAGEHGIVVTNTPDVLTEEVADTTLGLILMTVRELGAAERYLRDGKWTSGNYPLTPTSLRTRKAGILGLGRIGKAVARRLEAFGVPISYFGRTKQDDVDYPYYSSLTEMAEAVDMLVSVLPGSPQTEHIVDADVFKALGPDGIVINVGRGSVIDEKALIAALQNGTIHSAGLDVFEHEPEVPAELVAIERLCLLPHVGSASVHTRDAMGQRVVDNLLAFVEGKPPVSPVPETPFSGW